MLMKTIPAIAIALTMMVAAGPRPRAADRSRVQTWRVDRDTREAIVYAPSVRNPGSPAPLVLSFHGHGDNMQNFQQINLQDAWPEAIVVYFQGLPSRTDGLDGWQVEKGQDADRDLKLVDVAIRSLHESFAIDDAKVYATGFSNGANFTYLLWAERPNVFAAFAPVAARLRPSVKLTQQKPLFHVAGSRDRQIPFEAQQEAIAIAKRVDGPAGEPVSCGGGCLVYAASTTHPVMTWIHPGGHEYPPSTSERIVKFFREHPGRP
jgi:polyhydroxybutyrate depolymerase